MGFRKASNNTWKAAEQWLTRGYKSQNPENKLYCYERALKINPGYAYAWNSKGNVLYTLFRFDEALKCYDRALYLKPNFSKALVGKGNALRRLGWDSDALICYDKSISLFYDNPYAWNGKGDAFRGLRRNQDAIKAYNTAIKLKTDFSYPWNGKGFALNELGLYEEAIKCFDRVIDFDPTFFYSWYGRGKSLCKLERYDEAVICFEKVLKLNPEFTIALKNKEIAEATKKSKLTLAFGDNVETQGLKRDFIKNLVNLILLYARIDNKLEILNRFEELKDYTIVHRGELDKYSSQIEYMLKHNIPLGRDSVGSIELMLCNIKREVSG